MEKYGVQDDELMSGLRSEEHILMLEMMDHMRGGEKTAEEEVKYKRAELRLQHVRNTITEHDLKKSQKNG